MCPLKSLSKARTRRRFAGLCVSWCMGAWPRRWQRWENCTQPEKHRVKKVVPCSGHAERSVLTAHLVPTQPGWSVSVPCEGMRVKWECMWRLHTIEVLAAGEPPDPSASWEPSSFTAGRTPGQGQRPAPAHARHWEGNQAGCLLSTQKRCGQQPLCH